MKVRVGDRFGRWVTVEKVPGVPPEYMARWTCLCNCGTTRLVFQASLLSGHSTSCGCYRRERFEEVVVRTHGMSRSSLYAAWSHMRSRCRNESHPYYSNYGGRGIGVCERWDRSFEAFQADMGHPPGKGYSLDRIDNDGHYCPENCRWANKVVQNRNSRRLRWITIDGVTRYLTDWIIIKGMHPMTFHQRVRDGMTPEEALITPLRRKVFEPAYYGAYI